MGVKYPQPTFITRTLKPPKIKQCAFVTFPKYIKCKKLPFYNNV